ncbi:MAG: ATP-binding protein [Anaerolineae bacterium]
MINRDLIKDGQGPRIAFLETPDAQVIAETLVAFANTEGGIIVIGLTADGHASAEQPTNDAMQTAMQAADSLYNPAVVVDKWEELQINLSNHLAEDTNLSAEQPDDNKPQAKATVQTTFEDKLKDSAEADTDDIKADEVAEADTPTGDAKASTQQADDDSSSNDVNDTDENTSDDLTQTDNNAETVTLVTDTRALTTVYALRVPRSIELHALADGRVLIRSGDTNRPLGGQEILRLASAKSTGDFEAEVVPSATRDDFSREMIEEYLAKRAERTKRPYNGKVEDLLKEIGAVNGDGKPTVAGILMFSEYPQQWLPQSGVVFAKFVGKTPRGESGLAGYTRREELTGPLPRLIEASWNLIWGEMAVSAVVKGLEREERTEYPQFAVREAIVNAICHRDYRLRGRRIELRMYSDRLEVISPGGLPGFITVENIKDEHFSRNPRIVNGLFQWGYIEELGLGIDRMIEVMEQAGHRPPHFDARPYSFAVTLQNEREKPKQPDWMRDTNHRQAKALQYIRDNGSITNREYRSLIDDVSAETLRLDMVDMVEKGILIKVGSKKGTHYILK